MEQQSEITSQTGTKEYFGFLKYPVSTTCMFMAGRMLWGVNLLDNAVGGHIQVARDKVEKVIDFPVTEKLTAQELRQMPLKTALRTVLFATISDMLLYSSLTISTSQRLLERYRSFQYEDLEKFDLWNYNILNVAVKLGIPGIIFAGSGFDMALVLKYVAFCKISPVAPELFALGLYSYFESTKRIKKIAEKNSNIDLKTFSRIRLVNALTLAFSPWSQDLFLYTITNPVAHNFLKGEFIGDKSMWAFAKMYAKESVKHGPIHWGHSALRAIKRNIEKFNLKS